MALTAAQQAAVDRMNGGSTTSVLDEEDDQSILTQGQRDAIERMKSGISTPTPKQDDGGDAGSFDPFERYKKMYNMTVGVASAVPKAAGALVGLGTYVKGLNKIADPVAEGLYAAGDFIDNTLMTQDQLDKKAQLQTELQTAVQNMPPFPEDASAVDRVKFVSDYVINQGGAAGSFLKENPGQIANFVAETVPHILLGGAVGKGAKGVAIGAKGITKPTSLIGRASNRAANASAGTFGAVGEGVIAAGDVGAGTAIEQRAQGNFEYSTDRLYGLLAAPTTALIGRTGSKFSGVVDADSLATGLAANAAKDLVKVGALKKIAKGTVVEAGEEFLQSGTEQSFSNLANDKPIYQDVGSSAVIGAATGAGLGAGVNAASALSSGTGTQLPSSIIEEAAPSLETELAEAQAANEQAIEAAAQEANVLFDTRIEAAKTFISPEQFTKQLETQSAEKNKADIEIAGTPINEAFNAHMREQRDAGKPVYHQDGIAKAKVAFLKQVATGAKDPAANLSAYEAALDNHAAEIAANPPPLDLAPFTVAEDPAAIAAKERQAIIDAPAKSTVKAIEKAEALYGKDWVNSGQYDDLAAVVNGGKFRQKTFEAAINKIENPPIDVNALTTTREQKLAAVRQAVERVSKGLNGKNDKAVFDTFSEAIFNFEGDKYLEQRVLANKKDGTGAKSFTQLAKDAGVKDASSAKTVLNRIGPKLAEALGVTAEQLPALLASLRPANVVSAQEGDTAELDQQSAIETQAEQTGVVVLEPGDNVATDGTDAELANAPTGDGKMEQDELNDPTEQLDKAELGVGGGFGTSASVNQGAYTGVDPIEQEFTKARSEEANEVNEERVEAAKVNYAAQRKAMIAEFGATALKMWKDGVSNGGPSFGQISTIDQADWVGSVMEHASTNDDAQLAEDLRNIETLYDASNDGVTMENTDVQTNEDDEASGPDTGTKGSEGSGVETGSSGNTDAEPSRTTEPAEPEKPAPKIVKLVPKPELILPAKVKYTKPAKGRLMPKVFKTGKSFIADVFHGTRSDIQKFDSTRLGENTGAGSAQEAFFFGGKPETANSYAENPSKNMIEAETERTFIVAKKWLTGKKLSVEEQGVLGNILKVAKERENGEAMLAGLVKVAKEQPKAVALHARALATRFKPMPQPNVQIQRIRMENPFVHDYKGAKYREKTYLSIITEAKENGHDGVVLLNTYDRAGKTRSQLGQADLDNIFAVFDTENITNTYKERTDPKKFSRKRTIKKPTTVSNLQVLADGLFEDFTAINDKNSVELEVQAGGIYSPLQLHKTAKDAFRALGGSVTLLELKNAQGMVDPRDNSRAHLIAENIEEGSETAVIMHEVGVHLGLENGFLNNTEVKALADEVNQWSNLDETSVEKQIHNAVVGRLAFARINGMDESLTPVETIAYAVEEAVLLGVEPKADELNRASGWLAKTQKLFADLTSRWLSSKNSKRGTSAPDQAIFQASELVALASGAATGAMGQPAVELGAISKNKMDVMAYYANTSKAKAVADIIDDDKRAVLVETNDGGDAIRGQELFIWGKDSKFGTQTNIGTEAIFGDNSGDMEMLVYGDITTEEGAATPILTVVLDRAEYNDAPGEFVPNVYLLTIIGPEGKIVEDIGIPEDFDITKTKDIDGEDWVRLEGVRHRDVVRVLTEARRRMTRYNNGRVPNIAYNRVTGAAAANTDTGRVGSKTDKELFKRFSFKDQTSIPAVKKENREWVRNNMGGDGAVDIYDNTVDIAKQAASSLKFVHNIVRDARKDMPNIGTWWDMMIAADVTRNEIKQSFSDVQKQVRALKKGRLETINNFLGDSTFNQKWGYDPKVFHPDLFDKKTVAIDKVAQVQFNRLSKTEKALVADIFAHGERMRQRKKALLKKLGITAKFFNDSALEGPYSPLKRFGNNVAQLKSARYVAAERAAEAEGATKAQKDLFEKLRSDGDHYVVSFFDTMGAAKAFTDQNKKAFAFTQTTKRRPSLEQDRVSNPEVYEKVMAALAASDNSVMDAGSKTAFRSMVLDMYFQSMDERSARTSGARRLNRAGYDKNMVRSFLSHAKAEAGLIAQMENGAAINTALAEAGKEVKVDGVAVEDRQQVFNTITSHYQKVLTRSDTPIQDRIATANSVYMLLTSAGYHLTNATQPTMVTVPRIAGDFNDYSGTWSALFRGYKVALSASKIGLNLETEINFDKVPVKYHALLRELQDRQILDQGMEEDGAFDRFNTGWEGLNKASDVLGTTTRKLYNVAKFVESQNRISSAIAAYDMSLSNPSANLAAKTNMSPEQYAQQYAIDVVEDTQGNFSELDAPLLIKQLSPVKLAVQYRKYQLLMAWHYTNAFNQAFRSETKESKAAGKRVLGYSLVHAAMGAGVVGMPGASLAFWLATFLGDEEEPKDLERWIKENIDDGLLGDVLSKGVFTTIGLDLTTKLSQDKIMSPLPYVDLTPGAAGASDLVMGLAGPFGTTATNFFRSWEYFAQGDMLKGIEYLVPKGIRTAIESYRLGTEGLSTKSGVTLVDPKDFDVKSLLVNALGLPATEINRVKWTRGQQYELEQYFSNESSRIRKQFIEATKARDREGQAEARQSFRDNEKAKDRVRPFFNNTRGVLSRQSMSDLMKAPRRRSRLESREQNKLK